MSALLEPAFLRRLARLRVLIRRRFAGSAGGARRSSRRGSSVEFADHRGYVPGDDIRRIDWNAYARLEELVLRLYVAEEDASIYLLCDTSASLGVGEPSKLERAKRAAAALAYIGLSGSDRVGVVPFSAQLLKPFPPARGRARVGHVLRFLEALEPEGETDLRRVVATFLARKPRPGLCVIFSDLLDPQGYQRAIDQLLAERHEVAIFHVLDAEELRPSHLGALRLVDSERGDHVDLTLDARTLSAYHARLTIFLQEVERYAKRRGIRYVRLDDSRPLEDVLLAHFSAA